MRKAKEVERIKYINLQCKDMQFNETIGWKDIVGIIIAQFQILMPIMIGAAFVMGFLLFIIMKVWIRS
ncbi:hypothetical protein [Clostridium sp. CF012]|uniref:hypothetical protein n=1 Tax=Clostridium sp. CF012 TaxID=2843319 RepID=UPI001C0C4B37|nr:hypothetical protein [Clostridium sp. CF012]MBU3146236.1 hypothetical protein [Clostridium sp. CF012]